MQCAQEQAVGLITQYEEGKGEGGDDNGSFDPIEDLITARLNL